MKKSSDFLHDAAFFMHAHALSVVLPSSVIPCSPNRITRLQILRAAGLCVTITTVLF